MISGNPIYVHKTLSYASYSLFQSSLNIATARRCDLFVEAFNQNSMMQFSFPQRIDKSFAIWNNIDWLIPNLWLLGSEISRFRTIKTCCCWFRSEWIEKEKRILDAESSFSRTRRKKNKINDILTQHRFLSSTHWRSCWGDSSQWEFIETETLEPLPKCRYSQQGEGNHSYRDGKGFKEALNSLF
jgi:hypothetical protein